MTGREGASREANRVLTENTVFPQGEMRTKTGIRHLETGEMGHRPWQAALGHRMLRLEAPGWVGTQGMAGPCPLWVSPHTRLTRPS